MSNKDILANIKKLREITPSEREFFTYSAANYVKLKNKYLTQR